MMVSKKRLDSGFNGYRAPIIPRAPRSIRRRGPLKKLLEDNKLCAFELLAAVAGKLLQESESSASSNVAEWKIELGISGDGNHKGLSKDVKNLISESCDNGSCAESAFIPEISPEHNLLSNFKGLPPAENDSVLENTSLHASSEFPSKVDCDIKLGTCDVSNTSGTIPSKMGQASICIGDSFNHKVENGSDLQSEDDKNQIDNLSVANKSRVKDPVGECVNTNVLINSESSVQLPLYRDPIPGALVRKHWNNVKLGIRDDDETSFGCNKSSTKFRLYKPHQRIGRHRIRKMPASKYWKVAPKLKDCELYNTSEGMKSFFRYRKGTYAREECQKAPKKRKLVDHSLATEYDQDASSDSISNLPGREMRGDKGGPGVLLHRASGSRASRRGHAKTEDPNVKLSINSFRVPELYVEAPETATVGSLKRTVLEAVTAILGRGIRVGLVLQGKKVRDDSRTLQQAGITENNDIDALGFTLEPSSTNVSPRATPKKLPHVLLCDADQQLERSPVTPVLDSGVSSASVEPPLTAKLGEDTDICNECISTPRHPVDALTDGGVVSDSKALVPVPPMNAEALAVITVNPKLKRSELSQRRTRRPFSVSEVEALVEAVEKLGTGRWRDVKMHAFENADHRTYVDLKDKWKTLVHTASISPQQRRGEPVPQDLLNRVLAAHSFWSQHQSKQHGKHTFEPLKIVDACEDVLRD